MLGQTGGIIALCSTSEQKTSYQWKPDHAVRL